MQHTHILPFQRFFAYQPFKYLEEYQFEGLHLEQSEIEAIKSITIEDIYVDHLSSIRLAFIDQMDDLLSYTGNVGNTGTTTILILYEEKCIRTFDQIVLLKHFEKWSKVYEEKNSLYKLITHGSGPCESSSFNIHSYDKPNGTFYLVKNHIKESNKRRDPTIIPATTKELGFKNSSKPRYVINIGKYMIQSKRELYNAIVLLGTY